MIMRAPQREERRTNEQEMSDILNVNRKKAELVGDQNNSADQLICTNPNCQVCFGIDGQKG